MKKTTAVTGPPDRLLHSADSLSRPRSSGPGLKGGQTGHSRFKFDIQLESIEEFCSITRMIVDKISALKSNRGIADIDFKLFPVPPFGNKKMAVLSLTVDGQTYVSESCSSRWDNAFLNAADLLFSQMKLSVS